MKNEMLALILAGGQGTRLGKLTQSIAKPAVHLEVVTVLLTLRFQIVRIQVLIMLELLLSINRWNSILILETDLAGD